MIDRTSDTVALAAEFPPATYAQWRKLVDDLLKGENFEQRLQSRSADGLVIEPLYEREPAASSLAGRTPGKPWQVLQRIDHPDPAMANRQAIEDMQGGADGLVLVGAGCACAHGFGLNVDVDALGTALEGVPLDGSIALEFDLGPQVDLPEFAANTFAANVSRRGIAPESLRFGFDPLGGALSDGHGDVPLRELGPYVGRVATGLAALGFRRGLFKADGRVVYDAGGTEAQELAFVLAVAVFYLRALEAAGITLDDARRMIFFRLTADTEQFLTIAKFQALRRLWQRIEESCGLTPQPAFVSAETTWRNMTRNDPQTNILRATIAVFAAGIGGADAVTVLPYTAAHGLPDSFARRIARNTQLVLIEEANLARVNDPMAGTGWHSDLADKLARAAWSQFQEIERAGGAAAALQQGLIQDKVTAARATLEHDMATRRRTLVGANDYANLGEAKVPVIEIAARTRAPGASPARPVEFPRIAPMRLAQPFEALRDASDRMLAAGGARPRIFLASLGTVADFTARATFAKIFFAVGGIETVDVEEFASTDELVQHFAISTTKFACLCGTDAAYTRDGVGVAKSLRAAGATQLYLTGRPQGLETDLVAAGVSTFVHAGSDVLAILQEAHRLLGNT